MVPKIVLCEIWSCTTTTSFVITFEWTCLLTFEELLSEVEPLVKKNLSYFKRKTTN
jgi:hypothetical protein